VYMPIPKGQAHILFGRRSGWNVLVGNRSR
jgi:hypothetical protein